MGEGDGIKVQKSRLEQTTEGADLLVEVSIPELQESYGVGRYLLVRCVFKSDVTLADLENSDAIIARWSRRGLADDQLALMIVASLPQELQRLLSQRIEDRRRVSPAIVPIQQTDIETQVSPTAALRASLDRWLYRRDLFAINSPVDGRRFFGRDKPLAELRDAIAASVPIGVFGLRKVGKTSLLKETQRRSAELGDVVLYLDLSRVPSDISDCRWIYWKLGADLREQGARLPLQGFRWRLGGEFQDFLDIPSSFPVATAFDSDLTRLLQAIRNSALSPRPKIVLLLDEIERLLPTRLGKAGFEGFFEFFSYLRGIAQENQEFVMTVTGANAAVSEAAQFQGRDNPVFNYFKEVYLQLLEFAYLLDESKRIIGDRFPRGFHDNLFHVLFGNSEIQGVCNIVFAGAQELYRLCEDDTSPIGSRAAKHCLVNLSPGAVTQIAYQVAGHGDEGRSKILADQVYSWTGGDAGLSAGLLRALNVRTKVDAESMQEVVAQFQKERSELF